jgi:hypothetical protein
MAKGAQPSEWGQEEAVRISFRNRIVQSILFLTERPCDSRVCSWYVHVQLEKKEGKGIHTCDNT